MPVTAIALLNASIAPAKRIFAHAGLLHHLRYSYLFESTLIAGSTAKGCKVLSKSRHQINAVISGFRALPEVRRLDTLRIECAETGDTRYEIDLEDVPPMPLLLSDGLSQLNKQALAWLLKASDDDRALLIDMLESPHSCWLIDMETNCTRFSTGDILVIGGEPIVKPIELTWNRNVTRFWDEQDLLEFTRDIFQRGSIPNMMWRSKATTNELEPSTEYYQQRGNVRSVIFEGRPHRLVEMLEPPIPWRGQVR